MHINFFGLGFFRNDNYQPCKAIIEVTDQQGGEKEEGVDQSEEERAKKLGYLSNSQMSPTAYLKHLYEGVTCIDENRLFPAELTVYHNPSGLTFIPKLDVESTLVKMKAFSVSRVLYFFCCSFESQRDNELASYHFNDHIYKCLIKCLQVVAVKVNEQSGSLDFSKIEEIKTTDEVQKIKRFLGLLLGCAIADGNLPVTRLLLKFDFDVNQLNFFEEEVPFVIAARENRLDLVDSIVEKCIKTKRPIPIETIERALKQAIASGFTEMATYLTQLLMEQNSPNSI